MGEFPYGCASSDASCTDAKEDEILSILCVLLYFRCKEERRATDRMSERPRVKGCKEEKVSA